MTSEQKIWYMEMELAILKAHLAYLEFYIRVLKAPSLVVHQRPDLIVKCQDGTSFDVWR